MICDLLEPLSIYFRKELQRFLLFHTFNWTKDMKKHEVLLYKGVRVWDLVEFVHFSVFKFLLKFCALFVYTGSTCFVSYFFSVCLVPVLGMDPKNILTEFLPLFSSKGCSYIEYLISLHLCKKMTNTLASILWEYLHDM